MPLGGHFYTAANNVALCVIIFCICLGLHFIYIGAPQGGYDIGIVFTFSLLFVAIFRLIRSGYFKG